MNKSELIREVHERTNKKIALKDLDLMFNAMIEIMSEKLKQGEEIQLADFGTFSLSSSVIKSVASTKNYSLSKKNEQIKKKIATKF
jgi:nucleoid DNA-binding protein